MEAAFLELPRDAREAVFLAAAFFALGLTGAAADFFLGAATPFPLAPAEADGRSVTFFSDSVLDFLATIFLWMTVRPKPACAGVASGFCKAVA